MTVTLRTHGCDTGRTVVDPKYHASDDLPVTVVT